MLRCSAIGHEDQWKGTPQMFSEYMMSSFDGNTTTVSDIEKGTRGTLDDWIQYRDRAWCRLEMYLAATVPVDVLRRSGRFSHGLQNAVFARKRPHVIHMSQSSPFTLAPLLHSYLNELNPTAGRLSVNTDLPKIQAFLDSFTASRTSPTFGYEGQRNDEGRRHGIGQETFENGDVLEGIFDSDRVLTGCRTYATGNVYIGQFNEAGHRHGIGKMTYFSGNVFEGVYDKDIMKRGTMTYTDGSVYVGEFENGVRHGVGSFVATRELSIVVRRARWGPHRQRVASSYHGRWRNDVPYEGAEGPSSPPSNAAPEREVSHRGISEFGGNCTLS
jgi:hypothetical protein